MYVQLMQGSKISYFTEYFFVYLIFPKIAGTILIKLRQHGLPK